MKTPPALFRLAALACSLCLLAPVTAAVAGPFSTIEIVNDRVITQYEFDQRLKFMELLRQPGDLPALAMTGLVDDRLRMSAAKQFGVKISPESVKAGMEEFAARANLTADKFIEIIGQAGVDAQTFRDFVEAGLAWREIIRGKYGPTVVISETAIDRAMAGKATLVAIQVKLSEIEIPAVGAGRDAALARALKLTQELRAGADFAAAVRANSKAASAGRGGALDWLRLSELPPEAASAVRSLQAGQISKPVILDDKVVIYRLDEQKQDQTAPAGPVMVDYAEFLVPDDGASVADVRRNVDTCNDLYGLAKGLPADRLRRQTVPQTQLPRDVAGALLPLDAGESSTAIMRGGWRVFLMLCSRGAPLTQLPSRDEVRLQLTNQRLAAQAEIYIEELRSEAIIRKP
jgi:peptidyl-prolyl cis-trans isomerase SurA